MAAIFKNINFKNMPWKNGGGLTSELFRIPALSNDSFLFRLSKAHVSQSGPFSSFPNINRILILIEGEGFSLKSNERSLILNKKLAPLSFQGEEVFTCDLVSGPCVDFNVMTDRSFADSSVSVINVKKEDSLNFQCSCDYKFIYNIQNDTLIKLKKSEHFLMAVNENTPLIVVDVTLL